jgi:hypothetical protein
MNVSDSPLTPVSGDWNTAPRIVKGWAWSLAMIGAFVLPAAALVPFIGRICVGIGSVPVGLTWVLWLLDLFLVYAIRNGLKIGWYVQVAVSIFKLRFLPFGTALHAYLLSQWFKPEVKAWFGVR